MINNDKNMQFLSIIYVHVVINKILFNKPKDGEVNNNLEDIFTRCIQKIKEGDHKSATLGNGEAFKGSNRQKTIKVLQKSISMDVS